MGLVEHRPAFAIVPDLCSGGDQPRADLYMSGKWEDHQERCVRDTDRATWWKMTYLVDTSIQSALVHNLDLARVPLKLRAHDGRHVITTLGVR